MATKYIVHSVSRATDKNVNFKGDVVETYHGKHNHLCGMYHNRGENCFNDKPFLADYDARHYGYDRIADARRNYEFTHPENTDFWQTEVEIIAIEV